MLDQAESPVASHRLSETGLGTMRPEGPSQPDELWSTARELAGAEADVSVAQTKGQLELTQPDSVASTASLTTAQGLKVARAFVTGASGFLGRSLVNYLLKQGDLVTALVRSEEAEQRLRDSLEVHTDEQTLRVVRCELTAEAVLEENMRGCDMVYACAGKVGYWGSWQDYVAANVATTRHAVDAARRAGVPRFVYVSTDAVMISGKRPVHGAHEGEIISVPKWYAPYTKSKAAAELLVLDANAPDKSFSTVVVRPRLLWGRGDTTLLADLLAQMRAGRFKWVDGGKFATSTCHVANCCEGMYLAARKGRPGATYFLTDGPAVVFRDFITRYLATQGVRPPSSSTSFGSAWMWASLLENMSCIDYGKTSQPTMNRQLLCMMGHEVTVNDHRARRELGYKAHTSMDAGLEEMVRAAGAARK